MNFKSVEAAEKFEQDLITVSSIGFADKRVLFIKKNGQVDTTFDITAPSSRTLFEINATNSMDFVSDKQVLIGDSTNLKISVLINHVAKLLYTSQESRNLIISTSSRLFPQEPEEKDMGKMITILKLVKHVI